ncbi:phloretin 4'-O-glucosyltransferase-like [Humulus lupulus]|uniref:phloretin 4'-O-glucosyltransferase-like n=1 Tax=Humulus lupulus TaxID=3486 RepID=UPI002B409948|nr:phloretin 4'-O-glucosyltransferase-like [Humulus lupulus]
MMRPRFIFVSFPAHGHINPSLQLAKRLIRVYHSEVTFVTTIFAYRRMIVGANSPNNDITDEGLSPNDVSFVPFSDGFDEGFAADMDFDCYYAELVRCGSQALGELIRSGVNEGRPYTCIAYTLLQPWAADVAAEHKIPVALLWVQTATVFDVFYYYFHGYKDTIVENIKNPSVPLSFPGLPLLTINDLPTFFDSTKPKSFLIKFFQKQFEKLDEEPSSKVLMNTFDELEHEALRSIVSKNNKMRLIGIGPFTSSSSEFSNEKVSTTADVIRHQNDHVDYMEWLISKEKTTVVYVSFGSYSVLSKAQTEELAKGLLDFGHPFLWVKREKVKNDNEKGQNDIGRDDEELSCREELEKLGMIVPWCSQVEVLSNESLGCFVTHCGWNSTLESLVSGVPMVAFPQWVDQVTNAKLIESVWKTGVRVNPNEEGIVEGEEIKRCLELVMGLGGKENGVENGKEIRRNAKKWKDLAKEAVMVGGSSDKNLRAFLNEVTVEEGDAFSSKE